MGVRELLQGTSLEGEPTLGWTFRCAGSTPAAFFACSKAGTGTTHPLKIAPRILVRDLSAVLGLETLDSVT